MGAGEASTGRRAVRAVQRIVEPRVGGRRTIGRRLGLGFLHTAGDASTIRVSTRLREHHGNSRRGLAAPYRRPAVQKSTAKFVLCHF
jgi:hypothetical protein